MKYAQRLALALLICLVVPAVQADGGKFPFLQCGFQLGGAPRVEQAFNASRQAYRQRASGATRSIATRSIATRSIATRSIEVQKPLPTDFQAARADKPGHRQMPRIFTFAKFRCSWL